MGLTNGPTRSEFIMSVAGAAASAGKEMTKIKDVVIYRDQRFYSAFPSIVRRKDGELIVAFAAPRTGNWPARPGPRTPIRTAIWCSSVRRTTARRGPVSLS